MKKIIALLSLAGAVSQGAANTTIQTTPVVNDFSNLPTTCEKGAYFVNGWHDTVRSRRIDDRATLVVDKSGWGRRGYIAGRTFDLRSFNLQLDVSQLLPSTVLSVILGAEKTYNGEPTAAIIMDVNKATSAENTYLITCSSTGAHNASIPNFSNASIEDTAFGGYTGVTITAENNIIDLSLDYVDETNSTVTVNETPFTVSTKDLYARCETNYSHFLNMGMFLNDNVDMPYVIQKVGDATDDVYFGETGAYTLTKNAIQELETIDLEVITNVTEAKKNLDAIPWDKLYTFDQAYLNDRYTAVSEKVNTAFANLGNKVVPIFAEKVNELVNANKTLTNDEEIANAEKAAKAAEEINKIIDATSLDGELKTTYETALATYEAEIAKIPAAAKTLLENAVVAYENGTKTVGTAEELANVAVLRNNIPTHYYKFLTEEEVTAYDARIAAAETAFNEKTLVDHKNWKQGVNAHVAKNENGEITLSSCGEALENTVEDGNGLFNSEKISALDFEMNLHIDNLPQVAASWFTFGIMEKPEMWLNVDTPDVQNNKGVFFLITRTSESKLTVQSFICSLTSNRFFDSKLDQQIEVPCKDGEDLVIKMYVETKEVAGVTDEVFTTSFNGVTFDQENVSAKKIKTALGKTCEGHLMFASSGFESADPALITIKNINKHNALDETLIPEPETPVDPDPETPVDPDPETPVEPETPETPENKATNVGAIVGGVIAGVVALGIIIFGIVFGLKRRKH